MAGFLFQPALVVTGPSVPYVFTGSVCLTSYHRIGLSHKLSQDRSVSQVITGSVCLTCYPTICLSHTFCPIRFHGIGLSNKLSQAPYIPVICHRNDNTTTSQACSQRVFKIGAVSHGISSVPGNFVTSFTISVAQAKIYAPFFYCTGIYTFSYIHVISYPMSHILCR